MKKNIFYICNYDDYLNDRELITQPSGVSKAKYIVDALLEAGFNVKIYSTAPSKTKKLFLKSAFRKVKSDLQIYYISNLRRTNIIFKIISFLFVNIQVLSFLLKRKSDDLVLVYHSKRMSWLFFLISKIKKLRIYFEIEEIYSAVYQQSSLKIRNELRRLSQSNGNIVVNDIIHKKLCNNVINIPCYGIYKHNANPKVIDKNKPINIVYAGVIGKCKTDVFIAIETAKFLSKNYCIHILGYGLDVNIDMMKTAISALPKDACSVFYHGCLHGEEYSAFLEKCQIGLCTRTLSDNYSDYTFPSKICAYLSNNIIPICSNITCVKQSMIANEVYFVENLTPEGVAKTIMAIDVNSIDYKRQLLELHNNFVYELKTLFK